MNTHKIQVSVFYGAFLAFFAWVGWWVLLRFSGSDDARNNFTDTYSVVALLGGIGSLLAAKNWGMFKSRFGAVLAYLGLGLIMQFLGQFTYAMVYRLTGNDSVFPSIGDVPYFLSIVFYILGLVYLLKTIAYGRNILKPFWVPLLGVLLAVAVIAGAYFGFLNIAMTDERGQLYQALNVIYPVAQSLYFLLGAVAIVQSRLISKGAMFGSIIVLLSALVVQYVADFSFLYQSYHETWQPAGINDLLFVIAYGVMSFAIFRIDRVRRVV